MPDAAPDSQIQLTVAGVSFGVGVTLAAWLGSLATTPAVESEWFRALEKPWFYPPSAVFGIVWTVLYVLIAVAAWLAFREGGGSRTTRPWTVQLLLNLAWSLIFFGLQNPLLGLIEILLLIVASVWTILRFAEYSTSAVWLFAPYLGWICFAAVLNGTIVVLN